MESTEPYQYPRPLCPDEGHTGNIYVIKLAGPYLISGSSDKTIRIWDVNTKRLRHPPLEGHAGSVIALEIDDSPEQDLIYSGGTDGSIIIWQLSTGRMLQRLDGAHKETVCSIAFDKAVLVSGCKDGTIKVWKRAAATDRAFQTTSPPSEVATATADARGFLSEVATLCGHTWSVNAILIHEDAIISGAGDQSIIVWDLASGETIRKISGLQSGVAALACVDNLIVSANTRKTCTVSDARTGAQMARLHGHTNVVSAVHILQKRTTPFGLEMLTASYDGTIRYWRVHDNGQYESRTIWTSLESDDSSAFGRSEARPDGDIDVATSCKIRNIAVDGSKIFIAGFGPVIRVMDLQI